MPKGIFARNQNKYPCIPRKFSLQDDQKIAELYLLGKTQSWLAKMFHAMTKTIRASLQRTGTPSRSPGGLAGDRNPAWKGGRRQGRDGYVYIYMPSHPSANGQGCVLEHRLVMEKILGRLLKRQEVVHHKDRNPSNNEMENLILFSSNGFHLGVELMGKVPNWTKEGKKKILSRKVPSMKGIPQSPNGTGVRQLRRKLIQKFLHEISGLKDIGSVAMPLPLPSYQRKLKKRHGTCHFSRGAPVLIK